MPPRGVARLRNHEDASLKVIAQGWQECTMALGNGCLAAMRSFVEQRDFKALLLADPDIAGVLSAEEIERAFDLDEQLQYIDQIFDRVFHAVRA